MGHRTTTPQSCSKRTVMLSLFVLLVVVTYRARAASPDTDVTGYIPVCSEAITPQPLNALGFAFATLESLSYARLALIEGTVNLKRDMAAAKNEFQFITDSLADIKQMSVYFECARESVAPFELPASGDHIAPAAQLLVLEYKGHISINDRMIKLIKTKGLSTDPDVADQISSLQVERGQLWSGLAAPTAMAALLLFDLAHVDKAGHVSWLTITKEQKQALFAYAKEHFPELSDGSKGKSWSEPVKDAALFMNTIANKKASDE